MPQPLMPPPMTKMSWTGVSLTRPPAFAPPHSLAQHESTPRLFRTDNECQTKCGGLGEIWLDARRLEQGDLVVAANAMHRVALAAVGDEGIDLREVADPDRRGALELGCVGNQDDLAGIGDDGLRHLHLAKVEIEQRAVMVDGRSSDHRVVDLELLDEIDRRFS